MSIQSMLLMVLVIAATLGLANQQEYLQTFIDWISASGAAAPWLFLSTATLLTVVGVPRLLVFTTAGMIFGFGTGLMLSMVATLAGSYLVFILVRQRSLLIRQPQWPLLSKLSGSIKQGGIASVLFIRQLPLAGFYNNALLGLSCVSCWDFLMGSLIGFLPGGIPSAMLGADLLEAGQVDTSQLFLLGCVLATMTFGFRWLMNNKKSPLYKKRVAWEAAQGLGDVGRLK